MPSELKADGWNTLTIPIAQMKGIENKESLNRIKQLYFTGRSDKGLLYIDDVFLIELK